MTKNNHHYVPRFYLNSFSSEPRRINIHHLERNFQIQSGSIKGQCFRHKFYGKKDDLENALMDLEGMFAPVVKRLIEYDSDRLSLSEQDEHHLRWFIAFQALRTNAAAQKVASGTDALFKSIYRKQLEAQDIDLSSIRLAVQSPVLWAMENALKAVASIADLKLHLVINETGLDFVTSDNPVVQYNQYCEELSHLGGIGHRSLGLQMFLPISPERFLILYDPTIYRLDNRDGITRVSSIPDVQSLNLLSNVNAEKIVLFSEWKNRGEHERVARIAAPLRLGPKAIVEEFLSESQPNKILLRMYFPSVNVRLSLSFLRIRRRARSIPVGTRIMQYRGTPIRFPKPGIAGRAYRRAD